MIANFEKDKILLLFCPGYGTLEVTIIKVDDRRFTSCIARSADGRTFSYEKGYTWKAWEDNRDWKLIGEIKITKEVVEVKEKVFYHKEPK